MKTTASRLVLLVAMTLAITMMQPTLPGHAASALSVSPTSGIAGERVTFSGRFPGPKRPVVLQRKVGRTWTKVVSAKSTATGRYVIRWKIPTSTTTYRVYARRVRINGRVYSAAVSASRTVKTQRQTAVLLAPATGTVGQKLTATAQFTPVRVGRPARLEMRSGDQWVTIATKMQTSTGKATFTITANTPGSKVYRVTAMQFNGAAAITSATRTIKVSPPPDTTAPPVPSGVAADPSDQRVTLSWNEVLASDLAGYVVYQAALSGDWTRLNSAPLTRTNQTVTGLANGTTYRFAVASADTSGNVSARSSAVTVTPAAPPDTTSPSVPGGLQVAAGDQAAEVAWLPVLDDDLAGYRVYRAMLPSGGWEQVGETNSETTTLRVTELINGTTYQIAVAAFDATGNESGRSEPATVTPQSASPPPGPVVQEHCGDVTNSERWTTAEVHVLTCDLRIQFAAIVTVEPGTIIKVAEGVRIHLDGGQFRAVGTSAAPILIASAHDDTAGGDTDRDEDPTVPPTAWRGPYLYGTGGADLEWVTVRNGALTREAASEPATTTLNRVSATEIVVMTPTSTVTNSHTAGSLVVDNMHHVGANSSVSVTGNEVGTNLRVETRGGPTRVGGNTVQGTLRATTGRQSDVPGGQLVVEDNQITGSRPPLNQFALTIDTGAVHGTPSPVVTGNVIGMSGQTVYVRGANLNPARIDNVVADGQPGTLELVGRVTGDLMVSAEDDFALVVGTTICGEAASWLWLSGLTIAPGATLSLAAGATVKFRHHSPGCWGGSAPSLAVQGTLTAMGTDQAPVILTSDGDDSAGGDLDGDGPPDGPIAVNWDGVVADAGSTVTLNGVDVRYASTALFSYADAHAEIHGRVADSDVGVHGYGGAFVDARNVDWGDPNGPAPIGTGAAAAGSGVVAVPWRGWVEPEVPTRSDPGTPPTTSGPGCKQLMFLGVRGSGELPYEQNGDLWYSGWEDGLGEPVQGVYNGFAQALSDAGRTGPEVHKVIGLRYTAMHVPLVEGVVGGMVSVGIATGYSWAAYRASIWEGVDRLEQYIEDEIHRCEDAQRYVLVGYSQGALAIHLYLTERASSKALAKISAVGLVADPAKNSYPEEDVYSNDFVQAGDTAVARSREGAYAYAGLRGSGPLPSDVAARTVSMCHELDIVCAPGWPASEAAHTNYAGSGNEMIDMGAELAARATGSGP
ncbi:fibronectin type III domain-containing protein [Nocardioides sp. WG-D5]